MTPRPAAGHQPSVPLQPFGRLVFSNGSTYQELSRQQRSGSASRLAPGIYVVGAMLPIAAVTTHHLYAIVAQLWPDAVICDRSALAGGPDHGWLHLCHPEPRPASGTCIYRGFR